ncbi:MAG: hypothetical protein ACLSA2_09930 [Candidatus Gastranaerophilaceae bacterium]
MKLKNCINRIQNQIEKRNLIKKEKNINRYFKIHDDTIYGNSYDQLYKSRSTLANYAKSQGITIDVFDARQIIAGDEYAPVSMENSLSDKLMLKVTNILTGKSKSRIISADTDKTYVHNNIKLDVFHNGNVTETYETKQLHEYTFLRYIYRNVENLTKHLNGKTNY